MYVMVNVFHVNKKDTRTKADDLVIVSLLMILKTFSKPLILFIFWWTLKTTRLNSQLYRSLLLHIIRICSLCWNFIYICHFPPYYWCYFFIFVLFWHLLLSFFPIFYWNVFTYRRHFIDTTFLLIFIIFANRYID